ncbi:MAG: hypothetical protein IKE01_03430 [Clostridia bacterium]|nr:hypothetical protein [Clostridia bacterium]
MLGKIVKYDDIDEMGYILGYDETTYFYHQKNVKNNTKLDKDDIVSFDYMLNAGDDKLPYATNISKEKVEKNIQNNENDKSKAYKELYEIINCLPENQKEKISRSLLQEVEDNMDKTYSYKIKHLEDFENQPMLRETKVLLALIYRDYLVTPEERKNILQEEKRMHEEKELEKRKMYNPDVFGQKSTEIIEKEQEKELDKDLCLTVQDDNWFKRFVKFIKKMFKR